MVNPHLVIVALDSEDAMRGTRERIMRRNTSPASVPAGPATSRIGATSLGNWALFWARAASRRYVRRAYARVGIGICKRAARLPSSAGEISPMRPLSARGGDAAVNHRGFQWIGSAFMRAKRTGSRW